jgi:hypothetical protein
MHDTSSRRPSPGHARHQPPAASFQLEAEMVPVAGRWDAVAGALRLLVAWAVRAARTRQGNASALDSSAPQSDECTPDRTQGERTA